MGLWWMRRMPSPPQREKMDHEYEAEEGEENEDRYDEAEEDG